LSQPISFLAIILRLPIPKTRLHCSRLLFYTPCYPASTTPVLSNASYNHAARTPRKTLSSVVKNACLLIHYLEMDVPLLRAFASAGMCLPTLCLTMGVHVTICRIITPKHHIINIYKTPLILTFSKAGSNYRDSASENKLTGG
jgi:hypothetical protein